MKEDLDIQHLIIKKVSSFMEEKKNLVKHSKKENVLVILDTIKLIQILGQ